MKFALIMSAAFIFLTGAMWVFVFVSLWYGAIGIERAFVEAMNRWGRP